MERDKGNPEICTISKYHKAFNHEDYNNICEMCKNASIGCVACKNDLSKKINQLLEPFRERRAYYEEMCIRSPGYYTYWQPESKHNWK